MSARDWVRWVLQDWEANQPAAKTRVVLAFFRVAQRPPAGTASAVRFSYRLFTDWLLALELPWQVEAGPQLRIDHGQALVVHPGTKLGDRCKLRHGVTIGQAHRGGAVPVIGDDVDFGAFAIVLGDVHVGNGATIGAGAVVTRSIPAGGVAVGNPARLLTSTDNLRDDDS